VRLRTNRDGAGRVAAVLESMGVTVIIVEMPAGTMHLMGQLRIVDRDLAYIWEDRFGPEGVGALEARGYQLLPAPDIDEAEHAFALNFVTLGPREILMPTGCPISQTAFEAQGITCRTVDMSEIVKAAGGIGCLSGILRRAPADGARRG
jgi:arginine deiminase